MKRILVTGSGGSASFNFIDSLRIAPEKFYIVGVDVKPYHAELAPVDKRYLIPPASDPDFIPTLNRIIEKEKVEFVHAQPDVEVMVLSKNRDKIKAKVFLPEHSILETFANKMKYNRLLKKNRVSAPESYHITSKETLKVALDKLLKKHEKVWIRAIRGAGSKASLPVKKLSLAKEWIEYWIDTRALKYEDFMASEFLPGREFAFQSLWNKGKLLTSQARERIEYIFGHLTPSGQTSSPSVAKTVNRDDVNETATRAVKAVAPEATGVFCVDMKEDKNGRVRVIEVNAGRFYTTSNFFSRAGLNMPHLLVKMAYGEKLPKLAKYNALPENLHWVRMIDSGFKLVKNGEWTSEEI